MALRLITADERLSRPRNINVVLAGPSGVGKTTQARTLDPSTTLFVNAEAGDLALGTWKGTILNIRDEAAKLGVHPWEMTRALACVMAGPDPADYDGPYSQRSYQQYVEAIGGPETFAPFSLVYWDSATVAGRWSFEWSKRQPEALSEKTGKPDTRGAYGKHGNEMVRWFTTVQHIRDKSTILAVILEQTKDDFGRPLWEMQIDGSKAGRELPGIFDQVLTLMNFNTEGGEGYRAFVTKQDNQWQFPAKDRSGCLNPLEPANLGALIEKIRAGNRLDGQLATSLPQLQATA
jgi:hypothetical protein